MSIYELKKEGNRMKKKIMILGVFLICAITVSFVIYKAVNYFDISKTEEKNNSYDEEQQFLAEHVYGTWKLDERVYTLTDTDMDFSEEGQETLKEMPLYISPYQVGFQDKKDYQFQNSQDAYLFGTYGGYAETLYPEYCVSKVFSTEETEDGDCHLQITNLYSKYGYDDFYYSDIGVKRFCDISYSTHTSDDYDASRYSGEMPNYFFVDMDHPDVLYMEFCGIWKLRRVE